MEYFKDVYGYEGLYKVSNFGRVESLPKSGKDGIILKSIKHSDGYGCCRLYKNKKFKSKKIHRLVMAAFRGPSDLEVNHINGIKSDNNLCNLEYCTTSQNIKHNFKIGLKSHKGEKNNFSKLTDLKVKRIRDLLKSNMSDKEIGLLFDVHTSTINLIRNKKTWNHV
jgi:hypothetical protein